MAVGIKVCQMPHFDDVEQFNTAGNGSWISYSYTLSAGFHTFRWRYNKDKSTSSNDDCFYVDDIVFGHSTSATVNITNNEAETSAGGGLYAGGGNVNVNNANISSNQAATDGGGIYAEGGMVTVNNCTVNNNYAAEKGGGLYIPATGMLNLIGTTTLSGSCSASDAFTSSTLANLRKGLSVWPNSSPTHSGCVQA